MSRGSAKRALSSTGGYCNAQEEREEPNRQASAQSRYRSRWAPSYFPGRSLLQCMSLLSALFHRRRHSAGTGRVEMWCGGCRSDISVSAPFVWRCLSGSTVTPFPHPAHRTGRADFRHPALRLDSSHVIRHWIARQRQGSQVHASEAQHAVAPEDFRIRKPTGAARVHLVSTTEEVAHRFVDVMVDGPVGH